MNTYKFQKNDDSGVSMGKQLGRRYAIFTAGIFFAACGISLITKAGLGTSPITSPSLVLSYLTGLSLGTFTFLTNAFMFLCEAALLGRSFQKFQLLQLPATLVFSVFVDLVSWLLSPIAPSNYFSRLALLVFGAAVLGLGVSLEIIGDVIILPGEALVKVLSEKLDREFGNVKTVFDLSLVGIALLLSLIGFHSVRGIREGTVIAAATVGSFSRVFRKLLSPFLVRRAGKQRLPLAL